jgi:hypothetical protein
MKLIYPTIMEKSLMEELKLAQIHANSGSASERAGTHYRIRALAI